MRLFIAEKPSLAKAIFEGLGGNPNTEKKNGYFEHGSDVVTWCYGHMLELYDPQDYDDKYSNWRYSDLPIKAVYPPKYKIKPESEAQTRIICLLSIKPTASFIQATPMMKDVCWLMRFWVMPETRNPSSDCLLPTQPCASAKITVEFTT